MDERNLVAVDMEESGLIGLLDVPFDFALAELAEMADRSGVREFVATPIQVANYAGLDSQLGEDVRAAKGEEMINGMIRVGIVKPVEENANRYRIVDFPSLEEVAKQIKAGEMYPPKVALPMRNR